MTDVLGPVLIPYARFLEVRERRHHIVGELTPPVPERPLQAAVASGPRTSDVRAFAAVRRPRE
jgi:hypothetical protein